LSSAGDLLAERCGFRCVVVIRFADDPDGSGIALRLKRGEGGGEADAGFVVDMNVEERRRAVVAVSAGGVDSADAVGVRGVGDDGKAQRVAAAECGDIVIPQHLVVLEQRRIGGRRSEWSDAFVALLLLNTGCDVMDAVLFDPARIRDLPIEGRTVSVYRYKRVKTKFEAVVPLLAATAALLRSVPMLAENPPSMPFRDPRLKLASDRNSWSLRVR
jgi:hypothetical protein